MIKKESEKYLVLYCIDILQNYLESENINGYNNILDEIYLVIKKMELII